MLRSSYIDWLLEQSFRGDGVGDLSRWLSNEMNDGFEPVDMFCLLERAREDDHLENSIREGLVEFALTLGEIVQITDEQTIASKLSAALREEDYNKAARLRDELKKMEKDGSNN